MSVIIGGFIGLLSGLLNIYLDLRLNHPGAWIIIVFPVLAYNLGRAVENQK